MAHYVWNIMVARWWKFFGGVLAEKLWGHLCWSNYTWLIIKWIQGLFWTRDSCPRLVGQLLQTVPSVTLFNLLTAQLVKDNITSVCVKRAGVFKGFNWQGHHQCMYYMSAPSQLSQSLSNEDSVSITHSFADYCIRSGRTFALKDLFGRIFYVKIML